MTDLVNGSLIVGVKLQKSSFLRVRLTGGEWTRVGNRESLRTVSVMLWFPRILISDTMVCQNDRRSEQYFINFVFEILSV